MPRALHGRGNKPLVAQAGSGLAPGFNLATFAYVYPQPADILVVESPDVVRAEAADLSAAAKAARGPARAFARPACRGG